MLTWLDWFNVLAFRPISDPQAQALAPGLTPEALSAAIHCITPDGRIYRGARCLRFIGMRLPLFVPFSLILWIPGVIWIAEIMYKWISSNRYVLSRLFGCKGACKILPPKQREQDSLT